MSDSMSQIKYRAEHPAEFPYEVKRTSRRKSATVKVEYGAVTVIIPDNLSEQRLQQIVHSKTPWIRKQLHKQAKYTPVKPKNYVSGESFTYLGRNYPLQLVENSIEPLQLIAGKFVLGIPSGLAKARHSRFVKKALESWYRQRAEHHLLEKTQRLAIKVGVEPKSIAVKTYKSRWGSCSAQGDLSYNWKIIIADHRIVDYVVIHELCHIIHHNHSPAYWQLVGEHMPDYPECREWLKIQGLHLDI